MCEGPGQRTGMWDGLQPLDPFLRTSKYFSHLPAIHLYLKGEMCVCLYDHPRIKHTVKAELSVP